AAGARLNASQPARSAATTAGVSSFFAFSRTAAENSLSSRICTLRFCLRRNPRSCSTAVVVSRMIVTSGSSSAGGVGLIGGGGAGAGGGGGATACGSGGGGVGAGGGGGAAAGGCRG